MASVQEQACLQVVQFIGIWKSQRYDWRSFTAKHFIAQGMAKSTIYRIMKRYEQEGSVVRATGSGRVSGRRVTNMTREKWPNIDWHLPEVSGCTIWLYSGMYFENDQKIENSLFEAHQSAQI